MIGTTFEKSSRGEGDGELVDEAIDAGEPSRAFFFFFLDSLRLA